MYHKSINGCTHILHVLHTMYIGRVNTISCSVSAVHSMKPYCVLCVCVCVCRWISFCWEETYSTTTSPLVRSSRGPWNYSDTTAWERDLVRLSSAVTRQSTSTTQSNSLSHTLTLTYILTLSYTLALSYTLYMYLHPPFSNGWVIFGLVALYGC